MSDSNAKPVRAPMTFEAAKVIATQIFEDTLKFNLNRLFDIADYQAYLAKAIDVSTTFDAVNRMLWALLEVWSVKAAANLADVKAREPKFEDKTGWMTRAIEEAAKLLETPHVSTLPQVGETFEVQRMTARNRDHLCEVILDMQKIASLGICKECHTAHTRWNEKFGNFFGKCRDCAGFTAKPRQESRPAHASGKYTLGEGGAVTPVELEEIVEDLKDRGVRLALKNRALVQSGAVAEEVEPEAEAVTVSKAKRVAVNPADVDADAEVAEVEPIGKKRASSKK